MPGTYTCTCNKPYLGDGKTCALLGSKEQPGKTCLEVLQSRGSMAAGLYWLNYTGVAAEYWCEADGWTRVASDNFETSTGAWQPPAVTSCGAFGKILGGFGVAGVGMSLVQVLKGLPAHNQIRVTGTFIAIDSWDSEVGMLLIDGKQAWAQGFAVVSAGQQCGNAWGDQAVGFGTVWPHAASGVEVRAFSNLNEAPTNEAFAVDNVNVWVR